MHLIELYLVWNLLSLKQTACKILSTLAPTAVRVSYTEVQFFCKQLLEENNNM